MLLLTKGKNKTIKNDFRRIEDSIQTKRHKNFNDISKIQKEYNEMNKRVSNKLSLIRKK